MIVQKSLFIFLIVALFVAHNDAVVDIFELQFKEMKCTVESNPWIESCEAHAEDNAAFISINISRTMPKNLQIKYTSSVAGESMPEFEESVCELFEDPVIGDELVEAGTPKDTFPRKCPIHSGVYAFDGYTVSSEKTLPYTDEGEFVSTVYIGQQDKDPICTLEIKAEIVNTAKIDTDKKVA